MAKDDNKGWFWENEVTNSKIVVPEGLPAHSILDKIHSEEKKDWCLKWGSLDISKEEEKVPEVQLTLPDGTVETFIDDSSWLEKRAFPRKNILLHVTVISGRRIFRTSCENVSLGGLLLKDSFPRDYTHPELKVLIESPDAQLKILVGAVVVGTPASKRISFNNMRAADLEALERYLNQHPDMISLRKAA